MPATAMRFLPWLLFITLLLCPFRLPRSSSATYCALGLVNVAAPLTRPMASWAVRSCGRCTTLFNVPEAKTASQRDTQKVPPSQNVAQRRGKIFSIQQPQDLLDFVIEDERLSVGESSSYFYCSLILLHCIGFILKLFQLFVLLL